MKDPCPAEILTQIHIGRGPNGYEAISSSQSDEVIYKWEHENQQDKLTRACPPRLWSKGSYKTSCPRPILIKKQHQQQLHELSTALVASLTDIVDRWWFDTAAELPKRMPLGQKEQELLQLIDGLFTLFRRDRPVHLLKGEEAGIDIHMFIEAARRRLGSAPRLVDLADLRLVKDEKSKSGYTLCAVLKKPERGTAFPDTSSMFFTSDGEFVEEIYQVGLELHQRELLAMRPEMLREISLRCFNDMRTILLIHDKRMLGIVKQELEKQVILNVITPRQAEILDKGIADTLLPGSLQLRNLLFRSEKCPNLHQEYILKPIRSGKGDGIVFGEDLTNEEWVTALKRQLSPELALENSCVVQRRIFPRLYDVILTASGERQRCPLIGTYHIVNGLFLGLGIWRSSNDRICAVSHGGAWMCSVIQKDMA
ncbi:hypothetical protein TARUN_4163 [Trichoderma arundinaceum]|uniref:Taurine catabolism dioxygenase n=1 Tax=Trichoderma arundinaceum TaxID=490622 RepID=A0A395NQ59_TRIAR|nr:hypothetical protein TARUN_4163 [Trichoderma arundinaceum]